MARVVLNENEFALLEEFDDTGDSGGHRRTRGNTPRGRFGTGRGPHLQMLVWLSH